MADILQEIIAHKQQELDAWLRPHCSMAESLRQSKSGIIAEFKRKSPSKGWIHPDIIPEEVVPDYAQHGAAAISLLTNEEYFGGSAEFLRRLRAAYPTTGSHALCHTPILRKEFIIDPYQVYEAKVIGADAILLIAADLTPARYGSLLSLAHSLGLEVLLEIHDPAELDYLPHGVPDMLGVNNRALGTFHTDVNHSFQVAEEMQKAAQSLEYSPVMISESGIDNPDTVRALRAVGFQGFLIGEYFMRHDSPALALASFREAVEA